jgi:hypothetical protein
MVSSSILSNLISTVLSKPGSYGYSFRSGDDVVTAQYDTCDDEFRRLTLGDNPEVAEEEEFWCPDADTVTECYDDKMKSGKTSVFIWTRGDLAGIETPLLDFFDRVTLDDTIPYAIVRMHGSTIDYDGYYSLELHLEDGSHEEGYILSKM